MIVFDFFASAWQYNLDNPGFVFATIFLLFTGLFNSVLDKLADPVAFDGSIFKRLPKSFWLKTESWKRKYKQYPTGELVVARYDSNNRPIYKRRFWQSDKGLVFVTDAWHAAQFLQWTCAAIAFALVSPWSGWGFVVCVLLGKLSISTGFSIGWDFLFRSR